ncbi:major facilitator superfamily domain-containing protein [Ustulina deusta]|nr:major facilitator superfamily domain-containing protein [Ustulina deusta]
MVVEKDECSVRDVGPATECVQENGIKAAEGIEDNIAHPSLITVVSQADVDTARHYSVFTGLQKRAIILSASFMGLLSFMASSIYFPAINQIARDLHISNSKINLSVTTFLIIQGIAPTMIAGFSETAGRRLAYIICFVISIIANLGLALQNNYYALLFLRMLQSAGSCGIMSQALVGDCIVSAERGEYLAYSSLSSTLGPSLSPVIGGLISQHAGWHWIFWFLLIIYTATLILLVLFLPETCRQVVDDGSIPPPFICSNLSDSIRFKNRRLKGIPIDEDKKAELRRRFSLAIPNPLSTIRIFADPASALLILTLSLANVCYYAIFTDMSKILYDLYGFSSTQTSLVALPVGVGTIVSSFVTGKILDWNYRRHARKLEIPLQKHIQIDNSNFPLELARLQIGLPLMFLVVVGVVGYAWTLRSGMSIAGPIIFLFIVGYGVSATSQVSIVLMADIHPGQFAVAAAARNLGQSLLAAVVSGTIDPMSRALGSSWAYSTLAFVFGLSLLGPAAIYKYGIKWREAKRERLIVALREE